MTWIGIWFGIFNTCGDVWLNGVGQNKETNEEYDEDWVKERFQLARVKFGKDGEEGRKTVGMKNCRINIWDGSELELAWSKKSSSCLENNFPKFLLSAILNTSIFKVCDVLHWVNVLVIKTFSNIFQSTFCWSR